MPFQQTTFCENISRGTLSQASSILPAHSAYMSIKLIATKIIYSQALSTIHSDLLWMPVYKDKHSALYESEIGWCRFLQNGHSTLHVPAQTFSTHISERVWHRFFQNVHSPPHICIFWVHL
jgi:hypothetical protein